MYVPRPKLTLTEKLYIPAILEGILVTLKHFWKTLFHLVAGRRKRKRTLMDMSSNGLVTMQYPEERWPMPKGYRGAPVLVKDEEGREKCVSCQLCEFICPPKAIRITPCEIFPDSKYHHIEKAPKEFEIDMLRCIYCGLCEEVCPEEAIFLKRNVYALVGRNRKDVAHNKAKLYELGGVWSCSVHKWEGR